MSVDLMSVGSRNVCWPNVAAKAVCSFEFVFVYV